MELKSANPLIVKRLIYHGCAFLRNRDIGKRLKYNSLGAALKR